MNLKKTSWIIFQLNKKIKNFIIILINLPKKYLIQQESLVKKRLIASLKNSCLINKFNYQYLNIIKY